MKTSKNDKNPSISFAMEQIILECLVGKYRGDCNAIYHWKTKDRFKVRVSEHLGTLVLTGKRVKDKDDFAISKHLLIHDHPTDFEYFPIFTNNNNGFKVTLTESILTNRNHLL